MDGATGSNPFLNAHSDVLKASPEDEEGKSRLVEELKDRAKRAFQKKDMRVCDALYSKAIEVKGDDAPLYANRSAVYLTMNKLKEAKSDGKKATEIDAKYAKGFYRFGQACAKLNEFDQARKAYEQGAQLEPGSKVWPQSLVKLNEAELEFKNRPPEEPKTEKAEPMYEISSRLKKQVDAQQKAKSAPADSAYRGYKLDSKGRKTTFFNNELDEETAKLIGDIAPKKVQSEVFMEVPDGASAWNQSGTFEEKSHSTWARKRLREMAMADLFVDLPPLDSASGVQIPRLLSITQVKEAKGDASTIQARGKKKHVLDLALEIEWTFSADAEGRATASGTANFPDLSADAILDDDPLDLLVSVHANTPSSARPVVDSHIKHETVGLRPAVHHLARALLHEFQASK